MRRESRIRHSYASVHRAVKLTSEERQVFYNVGRQVCPLKPWDKFTTPLRLVARRAAQDGRPIVVAQTRALLNEVFENVRASVMCELPEDPAIGSVTEATRGEMAAECASNPDESEAFRDPSITNIEKELPELRVHRDALTTLIFACERRVNEKSRLGSAIRRPQ